MNKLVCYSVDKSVYNQIKNKCFWGTILNLCPDRGQSLVEWGNFRPFVHPSKSSIWVIKPGLRPSKPGLRLSQADLKPSQPSLRLQALLAGPQALQAGPPALQAGPQALQAGPQAWLDGPEGETNRWTNKWKENCHIL